MDIEKERAEFYQWANKYDHDSDEWQDMNLFDAWLARAKKQTEWQPIETAPTDGRIALYYRPLAGKSGDEVVAVKESADINNHCWPQTIPDGHKPTNPTRGCCHCTHWMPLPAAPGGDSHD